MKAINNITQIILFIICTILSINLMVIGYLDSEWLLATLALIIFVCNIILTIGFIVRNIKSKNEN